MPSLSIKNVPEEVVEQLKERAGRNRRSLQGELLALICEAVRPQTVGPEQVTGPSTQPRRSGTRTIQQIAAEQHARGLRPCHDAPLAVDIIRADRDAR
ncbi:MAG: FitA-like ribbon-helix-helix domain-containing protein [Pseudomonadales bacterium]